MTRRREAKNWPLRLRWWHCKNPRGPVLQWRCGTRLSLACRGEFFAIESINKTSIVPNSIKQLLFGHMPAPVLFLLHRSSSKAAGFWVGMTPNQRSNWIPSTKQENNYPLFEGWNLSWNAWSTPAPGRKSWSSHDITVISHAESSLAHFQSC